MLDSALQITHNLIMEAKASPIIDILCQKTTRFCIYQILFVYRRLIII